ncbi:hypothetical protein LCGC14_2423220 [marine sediment metagenome]|uniref:HTH cro/C1-type domain-containing protein n=1 Tax=marine sediment metagenome TaxID=412755 RepID=A0A0F9E143_9ZZZZ
MELDTIGKRIRYARIIRGLSQNDLARRVGVYGGSNVCSWEVGGRSPTPSTGKKLADALDCSPGWLLFGEGEKPI